MTRLFISLLTLTCTILAFYIALATTTINRTINNPSKSDYDMLESRFGTEFQCPCQRTELTYGEIVQIKIEYHQICSSGFVSPVFIAQLYEFDRMDDYKHDFLTMARIYFTHIALLCLVAQRQVTEFYNIILTEKFYTRKLMSAVEFNARMATLVLSLEQTVDIKTQRTISELMEFLTNIHAISTSFTSFTLNLDSDGRIHMEPSGINNCSCLMHSTICSMEAAFYRSNPPNLSVEELYNVTGIRIGCSPFQSTILSTLACWYSDDCYKKVSHFRTV